MGGFVSIARIVKTRGIRGELAADLLTDFPERFEDVRKVRVVTSEGVHEEVLERFWFHRGRVILRFEGLERPHHAEHLVGGLVQVPEAERVRPPSGTFFHDQLLGSRVLDAGRPVGTVIDVLETAPLEGHLIIETPQGEEAIVPLVRAFVERIDVRGGTIETRLPEGLLEVNRPAGSKRKKK